MTEENESKNSESIASKQSEASPSIEKDSNPSQRESRPAPSSTDDKPVDNTGTISKNERLIADMKKNVREHEGSSETIYMDPSGVATVGNGAALASKKEDKNTGQEYIKLHSQEDINKILEASGNPQLSDDQYAQLQKTTDSYNNGDKESRSKLVDKYKHKKESMSDYKLDPENGQDRLLNYSVNERLTAMERSANNRKVDMSKAPYEVKLATADTYYRGGEKLILGGKTVKNPDGSVTWKDHNNTKALREGKWGIVAAEIQFDSNKEGYPGNDVRNTKNSRLILDNVPEVKTDYNIWKDGKPTKVKEVNDRFYKYKVQNPNRQDIKDLNIVSMQMPTRHGIVSDEQAKGYQHKRSDPFEAMLASNGSIASSLASDAMNELV